MLRPRLLALRHSRAFTSSSSLATPKPSTPLSTTATPTSTSSSTVLSTAFSRIQASSLGRALLWYGDKQKRPYWTQFFSTVVIFLLSDFSAQLLVPWITNDTTRDDQETQSGDNTETSKGILEKYDPVRTLRHVSIGGFVAIPSYTW